MQKKNSHRFINLFAISISLYGYLTINIGLPAYPSLKDYFGTSEELVKFSITVLLLGFGFSQIIWGALSEKYGRRFVIITAITISVIGSLLTSLAHSIEFFTISRFIEGFGAGFATVLSRAIIADSLKDKALHRTISNIVAIVALAPAISPIIGGEILYLASWQTVYVVLTIIGILLLYSSFFQLKETHKNPNKSLTFKKILHIMSQIFRHRTFMGYFLTYSFILSGLITFYTISPYIFINQFQFTENTYSYLLIVVGGSYAFGSLFSKRLIEHMNSDRILELGFIVAFSSALLTFIFYLLGIYNFYIVLGAMILYGVSCGFVSPICNAKAINALEGDKKSSGHKGITSSILGGGIMIFSSIMTFAIAKVQFDSILKICIYITCLVVASYSVFWLLVEKKKVPFKNLFSFILGK
ncbi:multidrug effflux MFS transporter [Aureivirga sp. CE67]|uniref:multidrug effflux MFS transporter n=1 Tax=Aureivirga sp. CE67 TaxID=1788983 RepID=UPI0018C90B97|nr:multidrug effflux MFS transporter [Aureivirga sp. CE67]